MMDSTIWMISRSGNYDRGLQQYLSHAGFIVNGLQSGRAAVPRASETPEILLVDVADAWDSASVLDWLASSDLPKLFLLPPDDETLNAFVFSEAVQEFIVKPCLPGSVERHLRILLHRAYPASFGDSQQLPRPAPNRVRDGHRIAEPVRSQGGVDIDDQSKTAIVEGRVVDLTPKEFALLSLLSSRPGKVFSNEEIIENVWSGSRRASSLDVQQYVHHLRRKVEDNPHHPRWIKNVKGFGYKLDHQLQA